MKKYLFDFDGTLVDSMPIFVKVMLEILDRNNIKYTNDIVKQITPLGYEGTIKYFYTLGLKQSPQELLSCLKERAFYEYTNNVFLKNNVKKVLDVLKNKGYSLNILTASPQNVLVPCLKKLEVYNYFDNIWSCDDFNTTKTDINIYYNVAKKLEVKCQDLIFLDDNIIGLKTAKQAGLVVYGVYDETSKDYQKEIKTFADKYVYDFKELI